MPSINDIFCEHGPEYLRLYAENMPIEHKKVIAVIIKCRTEERGSAFYHCEHCDQLHVVHRGCGNRHCPGCQNHKSRQWLQKQMQRQLPGHHFMLTFTVPDTLRPFLRSHQREGYSALFASSAAIKRLVPDPKFIGADTPGFFGVLHTWGRQLQYHPHIHYVAAGGAFDNSSGRWIPSAPKFFLPVHALSKIYRAIFREHMIKAGLFDEIPKEVWTTNWNVNSQAVGNSEASIKYLTPYVFRVAISNNRIIKVDGRKVFFRYRKTGSNRPRTMILDVLEFIHRFLQHVLPTGFMKVRYFGVFSPSFRLDLDNIRARIELAFGFAAKIVQMEMISLPAMTCPSCGHTLTYLYSLLPHRRMAMEGGPPG